MHELLLEVSNHVIDTSHSLSSLGMGIRYQPISKDRK